MRKKEKIGKNEFFSIWLLLAGFGAITTLVLIMCISSAGKIPDNVGRVLTEEEQEAVVGRNSALAEYVYSPTGTEGLPPTTPSTAAGKWRCTWRRPTGPGHPAARKMTVRR